MIQAGFFQFWPQFGDIEANLKTVAEVLPEFD